MGLNYSFNLYYRLEDLEKALLETAKIVDPRDPLIDIVLPNGKVLQLPFWEDKLTEIEIATVGYDEGQHTSVGATLLFPDEVDVEAYVNEDFIGEYRKPVHFEGESYFRIGVLWLHVFIGKQYAELSYQACTTNMSLFFLNSKTAHKRFLDLMDSSEALGGVIDIEEPNEYRSISNSECKILPTPIVFDPKEGFDMGDIDMDAYVETMLQAIQNLWA
jgi:hypothetical protein